jgi:hypothetical protein
MNTIIRNSLLAFAVVGALSLGACKTTDDSMDSMDSPEPATAPADTTTPPMDSGVPTTDPTTTPPEDPTQDEPAPTTP